MRTVILILAVIALVMPNAVADEASAVKKQLDAIEIQLSYRMYSAEEVKLIKLWKNQMRLIIAQKVGTPTQIANAKKAIADSEILILKVEYKKTVVVLKSKVGVAAPAKQKLIAKKIAEMEALLKTASTKPDFLRLRFKLIGTITLDLNFAKTAFAIKTGMYKKEADMISAWIAKVHPSETEAIKTIQKAKAAIIKIEAKSKGVTNPRALVPLDGELAAQRDIMIATFGKVK